MSTQRSLTIPMAPEPIDLRSRRRDRGNGIITEDGRLAGGEVEPTMHEQGDRALMEGVRHGKADAFETLVEKYWTSTFNYSRHLSGNEDRAYDLTQETFSRLWEKRQTWVHTGSVRVWLLRTARNLVISDQRKWRVRTRWALRLADEYRPVPTPLQDTEAIELGEAISEAVRQLSPRRQEVFTLFHLQGLSYREISAVMGIGNQTVANYLAAALAELRTKLAHHLISNESSSGSIDEIIQNEDE